MPFFLETAAGCLELAPGRDGIVLVGRSRDCELRLEDDRVSRIHCCLAPGESDGCLLVRDLGSMNGTYINGQRLAYRGSLGPGDELQIGLTIFRLVPCDEAPPEPGAEAVPAAPAWLPARRNRRDASLAGPTVFAPAIVEFKEFPNPPHPAGAAASRTARQVLTPPDPAPARTPAAAAGRASPPPPAALPAVPERGHASTSRPRQAQQATEATGPARAAAPDRAKARPERRAARRLASLSTMLPTLVRMEQAAAATPRDHETEDPPSPGARGGEVFLGEIPRLKPGARWDQFRRALDHLSLLGIAIVGVQVAALVALLLRAFLRLAKDGLSVFIPFEYGGRQFTDLELVQIGFALAAVVGAAIVVLYAAWKHTEELLLVTLAGFGAGIGCGLLVSAGVPADGLFRFAIGLSALLAAGGTVLFGLSVTATAPGARVWSGIAAALTAACVVLLWWPLRDGLPESAALAIPMSTPPIAGPLLGAGVCAAAAMLLYLEFLRETLHRYADEPTRRWFDRYLIYHIAASVLAASFLLLTSTGAASGWTSGLLGLIALVMLVVDVTLFAQALRFARFMI